MREKSFNTNLVNFLIDIIVSFLSFLFYLAFIAIFYLIFYWNWVEFVIIIGFLLSFITFYYLRGKFSLYWTFLQVIANLITSFIIFYLILMNFRILDDNFHFVFYIFLASILFSLNKQIFDFIAIKLDAELRNDYPRFTINN